MSEKAPRNHDESSLSHEALQENHESAKISATEKPAVSLAEKEKQQKELVELQAKVHERAKSKTELLPEAFEKPHNAHTTHHPKHSRPQALTQARRHLKPRERAFSSVIHNPVVESVSDVGGATIARPSGLLWGGIFSLIGSITILIICRYYGYEYNYTIALLSFGGGFVFGLLLESVTRLFKKTA